jgi:hypothetical protein
MRSNKSLLLILFPDFKNRRRGALAKVAYAPF